MAGPGRDLCGGASAAQPAVRTYAAGLQRSSETGAGAPSAGAGSMDRHPNDQSAHHAHGGPARPPPPAGHTNGACAAAAAATSAGDTPRAANARGTARQPARPGHLVIQAISQVSHSMSGWVVRAASQQLPRSGASGGARGRGRGRGGKGARAARGRGRSCR